MLNPATLAAILVAVWAHPAGVAYLDKIDRLDACQTTNPCCTQAAPAGGYSSGYAGVSRHKKTLPVKQSPQVALDALIRDEDDMMLHIIMNAVTKGML